MLKGEEKKDFHVILNNVVSLTEKEKNNRIKNSVIDIIEGEKPVNICQLITEFCLTVSIKGHRIGFEELKISVGENENSSKPICYILVKDSRRYFKAMDSWKNKNPVNISSIGTAGNLKTTAVYKKGGLCLSD